MIRVTMPQAGQSMEEGTILGWRKREGEDVSRGEILLEIETDKANIEVEAAEDGILHRILCPAGVTVPVHAPIALLGAAGESADAEAARALEELRGFMKGEAPAPAASLEPQAAAAAPVPVPEAPAAPAGSRIRSSPVARRAARERGLELAGLAPGSGPGGRVVLADVLRAAQAKPSAAPAAAVVRRPLAGMRRAIARALLHSKQNIPHFYMRLTVDAGALLSFYRAEKERCACTLNDLLIMACARLIREFPAFRTRIEGEELVEHPSASIGLAVGMEDGLRVPVLVGAERMTLARIAAESRRVIEAAQAGKVEAMGQGVFTISNLGMFGIEEFSAIINPPESAILAVGAARESVLVREGALRAALVMTMTLSADHRVIDGLMAARFMQRLRQLLESSEELARAASQQEAG